MVVNDYLITWLDTLILITLEIILFLHWIDYVPHDYEPPKPHKPEPFKAPDGKMESSTVYQNEYTLKHCPPTDSIKPVERRKCPAKFDGTPTYKSDYKPWDMPPLQSSRPKAERTLLPKFDGQPLYKQDYVPHCIHPVQPIKPSDELQMSDLPFKGDTMYRTEYVPQPVQQPFVPKPAVYEKSRAPFEKLTTNKMDYTPKDLCYTPAIKPPNSVMREHGPMSDVTTNRTDFRNHGPIAPEQLKRPEYQKPEGDRYLDSTYKNDYDKKPICPNPPIHQPTVRRCEGKFQGDTNYRHDYVPWDVKKEQARKPDPWSPPDAPFESQTTFKTDYVPHSCLGGPNLIKPESQAMTTGPFDGTTNYRTDYTPKEVCPCCPAQFLSTEQTSPDGYKFDHYDEQGHQRYRNVEPSKLQPA